MEITSSIHGARPLTTFNKSQIQVQRHVMQNSTFVPDARQARKSIFVTGDALNTPVKLGQEHRGQLIDIYA